MAGAPSPELQDIEGVLLGTLRCLLSVKKPQLDGVETMTAGSNPLAYCGQMSWLSVMSQETECVYLHTIVLA